MKECEVWTLTIRSLPDDVPAITRLKRALKALLRSYGLKVVAIEDAAGPRKPADGLQGPKTTPRPSEDQDASEGHSGASKRQSADAT